MLRNVLSLFAVSLVAACASTPPAAPAIDAGPAAGERAARAAVQMVGRAYRTGGASPARGFDCSGLVQFSYARAGVRVPRSTEEQLEASRPVSRSSLRPGDLLFFDQDGRSDSHVGIYLGGGRFVHAPSSGKRVRVDRLDSPYWQAHLSQMRRF